MYERVYRVLSSDADAYRRLRLSRLFTLLQEASIDHTTELGMGRDKTLDRGLLWIIALQQATVTRLPVYDESVRLLSWAGRTMHLFFPRYYRLEDAQGQTLIEASALWALMDESTRKLIFPEEHGIELPDERTGREPPLPVAPKTPQKPDTIRFTVPYSYIDLNGHMNNARYFDLAEDCMPASLRSRAVCRVQAEYAREIPAGAEIELRSEAQQDGFLFAGEDSGHKLFKLSFSYHPT